MSDNPIREGIRGLLRWVAGERGVDWLDALVEHYTGMPVENDSDSIGSSERP